MIALAYNNATQLADLVRDGGNLGVDEGLETAVFISLFTRRRALPDDVLPEPLGGRGGYWADKYPDVEGDLIGSRLWLLGRSKASQAVMNQAKVYAEEALQWLIDDGVATSITVTVERIKSTVLAFKVEILRPVEVASRWEGTWQAHLDQL
jgi:phage gp46-like protein